VVSPAALSSWPSADWRFLLPAEAGQRIGFGDRVAECERQVLEESGATVTDKVTDVRDIDVLVLDGPVTEGVDLGTVPDGRWVVLRLTRRWWQRGGRLSHGAVAGALASHGLHPVTVVWHAPNRRRCSYLVDVADRVAVDQMLRRHAGVPWGRAKSVLARLAAKTGARPLLASDLTFVARRDGLPDGGPLPSPRLLPAALEDGLARPRSFSRLLVTPWFETSRHVVALYLDAADGSLLAVAKLPRRPWDLGGIRHEARVLRSLDTLTDQLVDRVPRVLDLAEGPRPYLLETALTGTAVAPEVVRSQGDRLLEAGLDLVARMPETGSTVRDATWFERLIELPLEEVARRVPLPDLPGLVATTLALLEPLRAGSFVMVAEHGDLSHPNLVLADGRLAALDWERSELSGLPLHDLCFLLQYVAEARLRTFARDGQRRAFDRAFTGADAWAAPWLVRHLEQRGVDRSLLPSLVLATFARSSAGLLQRVAPVGDPHGAVAEGSVLADAFTQERDVALWRHAVHRFGQIAT
jgi:aminoglycoside phosphotransferase (APT) family kinase protein